ncbi:hypothetical protein NDU88_003857 [Pleurodeles waltl]|uniref:Ig-like domain-containing protein n=1 Tax=Pleurodeles waltl TaxID=8319 RepID=A0AAV7QAX3_PLEWA|nr:hypothetical protein NDU88_003857 [Pleurodeles waltl]
MIALCVLCLLLAVPKCVFSQFTLVQSGEGLLKPSRSLELTCAVSGASITDSSKVHAIQWVRQPLGKGLQWVGGIWHDGTIRYPQSLQSRCTITRDTSKNQVYLQLRQMTADDQGTYYCARDAQ